MISRSSFQRRARVSCSAAFLALNAVLVAACPKRTQAAKPAPRMAPPPAASVTDTLGRRTIAAPIFGDAVIVINLRSDDRIELAASDSAHRGTVAIPWDVAARWADSVRRVLAYRGARPKTGTKTYRVFGEEPELAGGGITLARRDTKEGVTYSLFFADTAFGGFAVPLERSHVQILVSAVTRAVAERERRERAAREAAAPKTTKPAPKKKPADSAKPTGRRPSPAPPPTPAPDRR